MRARELLRRELGLVLRARVTWAVGAGAALLVGHSFVLALDLFSSASRSALGYELMQREMDPLAGVVRPVLGGLHLCATLLLPLAATRGLAIEKERRTYGMLALASGGTERVVLAKMIAASSATLLFWVPVAIALVLYVVLGGHLDPLETLVACSGHALHLLFVACASVAAAGITRTFAQAAALAIGISLASWAVDAGEGFSALGWLGALDWASLSARLEPFEHGIVSFGSLGWWLVAIAIAIAIAISISGLDRRALRILAAIALMAVGWIPLRALGESARGYDATQAQRESLPAPFVSALRGIDRPLALEVWLDPEDGRRQQLERDALAKLRLARPDLAIEHPLDAHADEPARGQDARYGRIVVHVGDAVRETRSTSRREIATLIYEAAGVATPAWDPPAYPGYPCVVEGSARSVALAVEYGAVPALYLVLMLLARRERRRSP